MKGEKNKKVKIDSPEKMVFDTVVDGAITSGFKGARMAWISGKNNGGLSVKEILQERLNDEEMPEEINEDIEDILLEVRGTRPKPREK